MKSIRGLVLLAGLAIAAAGSAWAEDAAGKWTGGIKLPNGAELPVIFTFTKDKAGKFTGNGESPSQAPGMLMPLDPVASDGANLSFTAPAQGASFTGKWDAAQKAWVGTFSQNGASLALSLKRAS